MTHYLAEFGQIPAGELVWVDDTQPDHIGVYMHPLHTRGPIYWGINQLLRQQIGNGVWQGWSHEDRIGQPPAGYGPVSVHWEIVPASALPHNRVVMTVEEEGSLNWLIREGCITAALRDEMNSHLERIAGGLFLQSWPGRRRPSSPVASYGPQLAPPSLCLPV